MYGTKLNASQYDGDIIIEKGDVTIIGRLKPGYPRGQNDEPVEQQPIWQIERIESVELLASQEEEEVPVAENEEQGEQNPSNEPSGEENNENEETVETSEEEIVVTYVTRRKYPYGNEDYKFKISEAFDYPYEYRH